MTIARAYGLAMKSMFNKEIDFDTDTVKVMLCTSTYVPNQDTHQYKTSVTNEVAGTNYVAGGVTVTGKVVSYNATTNALTLDATTDPVFTNVTLTGIRYAVFYVDTGSAATSPLLCYMDFETNQSATAADFTITLPASGILQVVAA